MLVTFQRLGQQQRACVLCTGLTGPAASPPSPLAGPAHSSSAQLSGQRTTGDTRPCSCSQEAVSYAWLAQTSSSEPPWGSASPQSHGDPEGPGSRPSPHKFLVSEPGELPWGPLQGLVTCRDRWGQSSGSSAWGPDGCRSESTFRPQP